MTPTTTEPTAGPPVDPASSAEPDAPVGSAPAAGISGVEPADAPASLSTGAPSSSQSGKAVPPPIAVIDARRPDAHSPSRSGVLDMADTVPIATVTWRQRAQVAGRVRSVRVRPWGEVMTLELVLVDATGGVTVVFPGRRRIPGIEPGATLTVEGMVGSRDNRLTVLNPHYDLRPVEQA